MAIVNVTPDSFFDGGRFAVTKDAVTHGLNMVREGADILDVGGESTRPGARPISAQQEMDRVLPVIEGIRARSPVALSVDTRKADVAREAIALGARLVNDVSALRSDEDMATVVARSECHVVLMHMQGIPETMQRNPNYNDVVEEIRAFLCDRLRVASDAGIDPRRVILDPGIGFGKRLEHNLAILRELDRIVDLGPPILVGLSRKAFLGTLIDAETEDRLEATIAANAAAILRGASIIRVHDAKEGRRTADVAARLRSHVATRC